MSAPLGELATDADVTRILHGRPAALDPKAVLYGSPIASELSEPSIMPASREIVTAAWPQMRGPTLKPRANKR